MTKVNAIMFSFYQITFLFLKLCCCVTTQTPVLSVVVYIHGSCISEQIDWKWPDFFACEDGHVATVGLRFDYLKYRISYKGVTKYLVYVYNYSLHSKD